MRDAVPQHHDPFAVNKTGNFLRGHLRLGVRRQVGRISGRNKQAKGNDEGEYGEESEVFHEILLLVFHDKMQPPFSHIFRRTSNPLALVITKEIRESGLRSINPTGSTGGTLGSLLNRAIRESRRSGPQGELKLTQPRPRQSAH